MRKAPGGMPQHGYFSYLTISDAFGSIVVSNRSLGWKRKQ